jgi:hypothetical protein
LVGAKEQVPPASTSPPAADDHEYVNDSPASAPPPDPVRAIADPSWPDTSGPASAVGGWFTTTAVKLKMLSLKSLSPPFRRSSKPTCAPLVPIGVTMA